MVTANPSTIGEKIRTRRTDLALKLHELAERAGLSRGYLSLIENDKTPNPPSDGKLRSLEDALGLAVMELVGQAHLQRTPPDVRETLARLSGHAGPAPEELRIARQAVGCPDVTDADSFAVRVSGDQMTPKYRAGDIVIFSPAAAVREGDDCFVRLTDGATAFGRVFFEFTDDGQRVVRVQPRNERCRAMVVSERRVKAVHKAVYKYQKVEE